MRVDMNEAQAALSDLLERVAHDGERVVISADGRDVAALVSVADLWEIERLEDDFDRLEAERILADVEAGREATYSLEEVDRVLRARGVPPRDSSHRS